MKLVCVTGASYVGMPWMPHAKSASETKVTTDRVAEGSSKAKDSSTDLEASYTGDDEASAADIQALKPDNNKQSQTQSGFEGKNRAKTLTATHLKNMGIIATMNDLHSAAENSSQPDQEKSAMQMPTASQFGSEDMTDEGRVELERSQILPIENLELVEDGYLKSDSGILMD
ncbi:MAG: hypothetical protein Q9204_006699 [Flavoplaca sp. TL-2023a]